MTLSWGIQDPIWRRPHVFTARPITDPIFIIIIIIFTVLHHIFEYLSDINVCPLSSWQIFLIKEDLRRLFDFERSQEGVDSQVLQWVLQKSSIPIERGKACVLHSAYLPSTNFCLLREVAMQTFLPTCFSWGRMAIGNTKHQRKVLHFPPLLTLDYLVQQKS